MTDRKRFLNFAAAVFGGMVQQDKVKLLNYKHFRKLLSSIVIVTMLLMPNK